MQKREFKKPRFSIDRSQRGNLARQIADGLRTAIETGYYRPGDILPPVRDLADILGVSMGIAVQAVNRIREEGLISPRPAVGSVVCAPDNPHWKGQVLIVVPPDGGNTADNTISAILRNNLISNGYLALTAPVLRRNDGKFDFSLLELMLHQQTDLVVQLHDKLEISSWLSAHNIPFICCTTDSGDIPKSCIGAVRFRKDAAISSFVSHCLEKNIDRVTVVSAWKQRATIEALKAAGIEVDDWHIEIPHGATGAQISKVALDFISGRVPEIRERHIRYMFFTDDYLTSGALVALLGAGIRIPEELNIVTLVNKVNGSGLTFNVPFTRLEADPIDWGRIVSESVLGYLKDGAFASDVTIGPKYVRGETF
jgi:DNA-binding LacI/PurR family transcriptional regulator